MTFTVTLPREVAVKEHTQVLVRDDEVFLRRIGVVQAVAQTDGRTVLTVEIFPEDAAAFAGGARATWFTVPASRVPASTAAWMAATSPRKTTAWFPPPGTN